MRMISERRHFSCDEQVSDTLTEIRNSLGLASNAQVLQCAIQLLGVATKVVAADGKIVIKDEQGREKEILLA